jgi:hypothetical protein
VAENNLEVGSLRFRGYSAEVRATLDVAFPVGPFAFVVQAGASLPHQLGAFHPEDSQDLAAPIDLQRAPTAFLAIGPEIRL